MPKKRRAADLVEVVDDLPGVRDGVTWAAKLEVAYNNPGRWCRVHVFDTIDQAHNAQSNLTRRYVSIPDPEGEWKFASRGYEVYAIYRGTKRSKRASVRRTQ